MISIKQVIAQIEAFATAHWQIKKFGFEFFEQMPNLATVNEKFPYMFVTPVGATTYENMVEFDLDVYCVDRLQKDRTNMKFTISDTQLILSDLSIWLEDGDHDIDVERIYPQTPINNALLDYVDGWVMKIKVQVDRVELCEVPMDGIIPVDGLCADALYSITDTDNNILYTGSIPSGGTLTQPIQDSTAVLKDTLGATISTTPILAEGSEDIIAPDSTYLVEYVNGTDIQSGSIVSGGSVTVTVPNPIVCADTTLEVNGTIEGTVVAGSTVDVQLSDSGGVVTPTSVTQVGNDLQIVLPDAPLDLFWELNYNGTDDVIFIPATVNNVGTLTSGTGSNVGTITVSTDGVTYGALSFPFTPIAATTYYFKRSTATVTGAYTMTGSYV